MRLPEFVRSWVFGSILAAIASVVAFLLGTIYEGVKPIFLASVFPTIPRETLIALAALFCLATLLLALWVWYLHSSEATTDRLRNHNFSPLTGIATHKKTNIRHCTRCLIEDNRVAPLGINGDRESGEWICMRPKCRTLYNEKKGE